MPDIDFNSAESVLNWTRRQRRKGCLIVMIVSDENDLKRGHSTLMQSADFVVDTRDNTFKLIKAREGDVQ